jgi:plastocyanin
MKRIIVFAFVVALLLSFSVSIAEKEPQVVTITCPLGGEPNIGNPLARISAGETVTFNAVCTGDDGCVDGVNVTGAAPIGNFDLTPPDNQQQVITFPSAGTYEYDVTKLGGGKGITHGVVEVSSTAVPTMTQWGIMILVALMIGSAVFMALRRRRAAVPA